MRAFGSVREVADELLEFREVERSAGDAGDAPPASKIGTAIVTIGTYDKPAEDHVGDRGLPASASR